MLDAELVHVPSTWSTSSVTKAQLKHMCAEVFREVFLSLGHTSHADVPQSPIIMSIYYTKSGNLHVGTPTIQRGSYGVDHGHPEIEGHVQKQTTGMLKLFVDSTSS